MIIGFIYCAFGRKRPDLLRRIIFRNSEFLIGVIRLHQLRNPVNETVNIIALLTF